MTDCIICLENLESSQVLQLIPCLHLVHTTCVLTWFNFENNEEICPHCKLDIFETEVFKDGKYHLPSIYYE